MNKPFNVNYDLQGITKVSITLHPERNIILPLEHIQTIVYIRRYPND